MPELLLGLPEMNWERFRPTGSVILDLSPHAFFSLLATVGETAEGGTGTGVLIGNGWLG